MLPLPDKGKLGKQSPSRRVVASSCEFGDSDAGLSVCLCLPPQPASRAFPSHSFFIYTYFHIRIQTNALAGPSPSVVSSAVLLCSVHRLLGANTGGFALNAAQTHGCGCGCGCGYLWLWFYCSFCTEGQYCIISLHPTEQHKITISTVFITPRLHRPYQGS